MNIRRIVPNFRSEHLAESRAFYEGFLGLTVAMDMSWIITFVSSANPTAQVSVLTFDQAAPVVPDASLEVENVDLLHTEAVRRGLEIIYPLTDEPWEVRRFFVRDPNGKVINLMTHLVERS